MTNRLCPSCGQQVPSSFLFCPTCRAQFNTKASATTVNPSLATPHSSKLSGTWTGKPLTDAKLGARCLAFLIDFVLLGCFSILLMQIIPILGGIMASWMYYSLSETSAWQATIGKKIMGIRVVDVNGVPLRFGKSSLRFLSRFVSALPLGAGFLIAFFTPHHQALHDMFANTRVVSR